jgi:hypothetical protein
VQAGIAIHYAKKCNVHLRQIALNTKDGIIVRKWFDTSSLDVDLCHRIETLTHKLKGSNIVVSGSIRDKMTSDLRNGISLGSFLLKGQPLEVDLFLIKSDLANESDVTSFIEYLKSSFVKKAAA